jgi:predicted acyl esterase
MGTPGPAIGFLQEALRWWDQWLKGRDTGIMDEPLVRVWMQEAIRPDPVDPKGEGHWIAAAAWPPAESAARSYALNPGRLDAAPTATTQIAFTSPQTTGLAGGEWCPLDSGGGGPEFQDDQRADDGKSLVFDSLPLDSRIEIVGAPVLDLDLAVDRPLALVAARLCDVAPDGASVRISFGFLNLAHRDGHANPVAMEPGRRMRVRLQLNDTAYAFRPGHRIRLALSTSYWPMVWPSPQPVQLTLFTGTSRLDLPVRVAASEADARIAFAPPVTSPPLARTVMRQHKARRWIEQDLGTGETVLTHTEDRGVARLDDIGVELGYVAFERYAIRENDPLSARTKMQRTVTARRDEWSVRTETWLNLSCDARDFRLTARLEAYEGETRIYERDWDETIPRDFI